MAHLSSSFASPYAGTLEVVLQGVFFQNTRRDAGFPSVTGGTANMLIRPYVGPSGDRTYGQPIDRYAPTVTFLADYPGGNVTWPFGTELVASTNGGLTGLYAYGLLDLRIDITLRREI